MDTITDEFHHRDIHINALGKVRQTFHFECLNTMDQHSIVVMTTPETPVK